MCAYHTMAAFCPKTNKVWCDYFHGVNTEVNDFDLGWIVALLEGEGCFTADRHDVRYEKRYPRITLAMTDLDVVQRAAKILGCGSIMKPRTPQGPNSKPQHRCVLVGRKAEAWMRKLEPYMGERRKAKIRQILDAWGEGHQPTDNTITRLHPEPMTDDKWLDMPAAVYEYD